MNQKIIGIGELYCSNKADQEILTLGLGSCIALVLAHPPSQAAAMAHIALPYSKSRHIHEKARPSAYFADLAIPRMLEEIKRYTGTIPINLEIAVVGGASMRGKSSMEIGAKNLSSIVRNLERFRLKPQKVRVGGVTPRNVRVQVGTGSIWIKEEDTPEQLLHSAQNNHEKTQRLKRAM